jgi:rSAM/selenodomain-associated transferase 1
MAKAPKQGMVKTRLSPSMPVSAVTELYCCLLQDTIAMAKSLNGLEIDVMCPEPDKSDLARLLGDTVLLVTQNGNGLAAGLTSVFAQFAASGQRRVIAFNSDSPHLPPSVLDCAFQTLTTHEIVVGPTHDGGYYLVGAKAAYPNLFEGDGMGTKSALDTLLARVRQLGLSIGFTDTFYDIDIADDLTRLAAELRLAPQRAPRTAAWLKERELSAAQLRMGTGQR